MCTHTHLGFPERFWPSANLLQEFVYDWILHKSLFHTLWNSIISPLLHLLLLRYCIADLLSKVFACLDFFRITFFVLRVWEFFPQSLTPGQDNKQWGELRKEKHLERKCYPDSAKSTLKCIFNLVELFRKMDWKIKTINASSKINNYCCNIFSHSVWNNLVFYGATS